METVTSEPSTADRIALFPVWHPWINQLPQSNNYWKLLWLLISIIMQWKKSKYILVKNCRMTCIAVWMNSRQLLLKNWTTDNQNESLTIATTIGLREEFYIVEVGKYKPMQIALMFCTKTAYLKFTQVAKRRKCCFCLHFWLLYNYHSLYLNILLPHRWNNLLLKNIQIYAVPSLLLLFLLFFLCYKENNGSRMYRQKLELFILIKLPHKGDRKKREHTAHYNFVKLWLMLW